MHDIDELVRGHYGGADFESAILAALHDAGRNTDALTVEDLAPVDQLHLGGLPATRYLLQQLDLDQQTRLLDVGCGIGGPARVASAQYACPTVGIDLSPDFVTAARSLTQRVRLSALVHHQVASGDHLDFKDGSFSRAMLIHVGMNIPDKRAVFTEVRRVLQPGGWFGLFEQMQVGDGAPSYPLPWAEDERSSFLTSPETYQADLEAAGFVVERCENRTAAASPVGGARPTLSPAAVFGAKFTERLGNNLAAARAGIIQPVLMVARAS
jgi:SAM-dependent methyltransferase